MMHVHGKGVTHSNMRMCMLMSFRQLHFIPTSVHRLNSISRT